MAHKLTQRQRVHLIQLAQLQTDLRYRQGVKRRMIRDLWQEGVSVSAIGRALGLAPGTVSSYIRTQVVRGWDGTDRRTTGDYQQATPNTR